MLTLAQRQEIWQMKGILATLKATLIALEMLLSIGSTARARDYLLMCSLQ